MSEKKIIRYKDKYLGVKELADVDVSPYVDRCEVCYCKGDIDMCHQLAEDFNIGIGLCPAYSLFYNIKSFSLTPKKQCIFTGIINTIFICYE